MDDNDLEDLHKDPLLHGVDGNIIGEGHGQSVRDEDVFYNDNVHFADGGAGLLR